MTRLAITPRPLMKKICRLFIVATVIALAIISLSSAYSVDIRSNSVIGKYLVDSGGMTLYYFANDLPKTSTCFDSCSDTWMPFYSESVDIPGGLNSTDFDQIGRVDGKYQTTYKGQPLYLYSGDHNPGDTNGEGVNGRWFAERL